MKLVLISILFIFIISNSYSQWINTNGLEGGIIISVAADENYLFIIDDYYKIYRSSISSPDWQQIHFSLLEFKIPKCISLKNQQLFVGTNTAIYFSSDYGINWNLVLNNVDVYQIKVFCGNIYASTKSGLYLPKDNVQNWNKIRMAIDNNPIAGYKRQQNFLFKF